MWKELRPFAPLAGLLTAMFASLTKSVHKITPSFPAYRRIKDCHDALNSALAFPKIWLNKVPNATSAKCPQ